MPWTSAKAHQKAQDTADAAALAAARDLSNGDPVVIKARATATAEAYVDANMPSAPEPAVEFPYIPSSTDVGATGGGEPDYTKIEVTVTHATGTFFGRLFGLIAPTVSRRAVAERLEGSLAIYAHEYRCVEDALVQRGDDQQIQGGVHSDGSYTVEGHGSYTTAGTYRVADYDPGCTPSIDPGNSFGGNSSPTASARKSWPEFFAISDFADDGCLLAGEILFDQDGGTIPRGVYCADTFTVDADNVSGEITVIARKITVRGSGHRFESYADGGGSEGLLFFVPPNVTPTTIDDGPVPEEICSKSMEDIDISGSGHRLEGIIFNPCTLTRISQESEDGSPLAFDLEGQIIGMWVEIEGDRLRMTGTGAGSSVVLSLAE
jgi:hypothetical protein